MVEKGSQKDMGLNIVMSRWDESDGRQEYTWQGTLLVFSCFLCGLLGCAGAFLEAFPVPCNHKMLYAGVLLISILYAVLWLLQRFWKWLSLFLVPVTGIAISYYFKDIGAGLVLISKTIRGVIVYQDQAFRIDATAEEANKIIISFLFLAILWAGILWISTWVWCIRTLTLFCLGLILAGILAVGLIPAFWAVCLMVYCCLGNFAGQNVEWSRAGQKGMLLTLIIGLVLLAAGSLWGAFYPKDLAKDLEQLRAGIQDTSLIRDLIDRLPKMENPYAVGGVGNGELGQVENVRFTGNTALQVVTDTEPQETIYFRGYVGTKYTGKRWKSIEDSKEEDISRLIFEDKKYWMETLYQSQPSWVYIKRINASSKYQFRPYLSLSLNDSSYKEYDYRYIPNSQMLDVGGSGIDSNYDNNIKAYSEFVYKNYLSYPGEDLPRLLAQCRDNPFESLGEIKEYIVSSLGSMAEYNLQVGKFPGNEEFTEYFLYEAKQGYCTHFATAAVLMFRMYGIPARYAEGYIAPPSTFHLQLDEYVADITDDHAHAWAEIYTEDMGWMPVEATPGYAIGEAQNQRSEETQKAEHETDSTGSEKANTEGMNAKETNTKETKVEQGETGINKESLKKIIISNHFIRIGAGILGILLLLFLIKLRRTRILRKRKVKNAREMFHDIYEVLRVGGLTTNVDCQKPEFPSFVARKFAWIEKEDFAAVMKLIMYANFGKGVISPEEIKFIRDVYRHICTHVYKDLNVFKKITFRYWKAYN